MPRALFACIAAYSLLASCGNDTALPRADDLVDAGTDAVGEATSNGTLPCEIQQILSDRCAGCHGATLANGAPIHLVSYADLVGKTSTGKQVAQRALDRITANQMPPEPAAPLSDGERAVFAAWVEAGTPTGDCTKPPGPFDGPPVCTSETMWTRGDRGSPVMHPGVACIACHTRQDDDDAPRFRIAGTAYPTGHEPDNCNGATPAVVEVTAADGKVFMLNTNAAGNFFSTARIAFPIHVAVLAGGKRRAMISSPPTGDCNSCHTQDGANMAPGRITLP